MRNAVIYGCSWILKIVCYLILFLSSASGNISKFACYLVSFSQKAHLTFFNMIALDLIIYGIRGVFHSRDESPSVKFLSGILVTFMVLDYIEIWFLGSRAQLMPFEARNPVAEEGKANFEEKNVTNCMILAYNYLG